MRALALIFDAKKPRSTLLTEVRKFHTTIEPFDVVINTKKGNYMQLDTILREEYSRLSSLGHSVYPLQLFTDKSGKEISKPIFPWRNAKPIGPESLKNAWPYTIGLSVYCGQESGLMAIDVDIINPDKAKALIDFIQSVAPTKYGKFGSKGLTLFYQWASFAKHQRIEPKTGNKQTEFDTCVDIISNGLCTVPPSKHIKTGGSYSYPDGYLPLPKVSELPSLSINQYDLILNKIKADAKNESKQISKEIKNDSSARFYQIQQKAMDLCRKNNDISDNDLIMALKMWDKEQNFPKGPYFEDREHQSAESVIRGCKNKIAAEFFKNKDAFEKFKQKKECPKLPAPSGYIRKIYECLKITASSAKDHNFRYLSSLFIFSNLINKKIIIRHGTSFPINSAMFCFILGDTGSGKSSIINQIKKFIDNYPKPLGGTAEVVHKGIGVSLARVYDDIEEYATTVFVEEEAKSFLEKLTRQHSHGSLESFDSYFTTLWDQKEYIDNPSKSMNSKNNEVRDKKEKCMVSLFVGTTKKSFLESVTSDIIENGLLNRCFVLDVETDTELNDFDGEQFTSDEINKIYYKINSEIKDHLPFEKQIKITKNTNPEVMKFFSEKELEGRLAVSKGDSYQARKVVLICKIALLLKASDEISFKDIELSYYLEAEKIYNIMQESFSVLLSDLKSGSKQEIAKRQIVRFVIECGENGVSVPKIQGIKIPQGTTKIMLIKQLESEGLLIVENKKNDSLMRVRANFLAIYNSNYF